MALVAVKADTNKGPSTSKGPPSLVAWMDVGRVCRSPRLCLSNGEPLTTKLTTTRLGWLITS